MRGETLLLLAELASHSRVHILTVCWCRAMSWVTVYGITAKPGEQTAVLTQARVVQADEVDMT